MIFPFSPSVTRVRLLGDLFGFFVQVAGLLPLPTLFFGSLLAYTGALPFAHLATNTLEVPRVFPLFA
jgi:hypothetical protein